MANLNKKLRRAVQHFWRVRAAQARKQGSRTGQKDAGTRAAVTGGAQMDGFVTLIKELLVENGVPRRCIFTHTDKELPGYFRAEKQWDLVVVINGVLIISLEVKSQVGSFGNNFNNRTEEALGSATDLWAAFREGAFKPSARPWLGYLMLLEKTDQSIKPVRVGEPHFKVFSEFKGASYALRYEILITKLVRERLYDSACLLLSEKIGGKYGNYGEPNVEIGFNNFVQSLLAKAIASLKMKPR